jgi:hypothetical protein
MKDKEEREPRLEGTVPVNLLELKSNVDNVIAEPVNAPELQN